MGLHCGCVPAPVKIRVSVRWVPLWVRPPPLCEYIFVCSLGYIVGASPPRVCPFIGRHSSLDPCMLPTPLCGIFKLRLGALIPRSVGLSVCLSVGLSSKNYKKNIKLYKTLQNLPKHQVRQ